MKQKLLLLAAVFFGVMAFMLTFQQINQEKRKIQAATTDVAVLQLVKDIAENEPITEDAIRGVKIKMYSAQLSASRHIPYSQKNLIINRKAQLSIPRGKILQWNDLQNAVSGGKDGLTRLIQPGYRAVSIAVDQTDPVLLVQDPGVNSGLEGDHQGLDIGPQVIDPPAGGSQDQKFPASQSHGKPYGDLRIRGVFDRVIFPYGHIRLIAVIISDLPAYAVKIPYNVAGHDLVTVEEFHPLVHPDDILIFFFCKQGEDKFFL